ncbi:hypothetical protein BJF88_07510 [Cellulosimicrobium sp. CUA-896]|nr:hypothetical protein BJF88_07510 [Cellulosimicrobium sp. CUA-896]
MAPGDLTLPLTYQFQPGTEADGVTVHVPISVLNRVTPDGFDWMVPGLLDELATATIRSLPKPVRVQLVPAPDVARDVVAWLREHTPAWEDMARAGDMAEPFPVAFTRAVRALRDVIIPDDAWGPEQAARLPAHLRMTFRVVDPRRGGEVVLDESKDLLALQRRLAAQNQAAVRAAVKGAVGAALREASGAGSGEGTAVGARTPSAPLVPRGAPARPATSFASDGRPSPSRPAHLPARHATGPTAARHLRRPGRPGDVAAERRLRPRMRRAWRAWREEPEERGLRMVARAPRGQPPRTRPRRPTRPRRSSPSRPGSRRGRTCRAG